MNASIARTLLPVSMLLFALCSPLGMGEARAQTDKEARTVKFGLTPDEVGKMILSVKQRAEAGNAEAQYLQSTLYGEDAEKESAVWALRAAEQGHVKAQARVGLIYDLGQGFPKSETEAKRWLTLAAEKGQKTAQYHLGRKYALGLGVTKDASQARKWLGASAEQGHVLAQYELGRMERVSGDRKQAVRWLRASAEQGYATAQCELAKLLDRAHPDEGSRTAVQLPPEWQKERAEAKKWYQAAAEGGAPEAQRYMALHAADQIEALKWYYLVVFNQRLTPYFDTEEFAEISKLERSLGASERKEASLRAKKWISERPARNALLRGLLDDV